MWLVLGTPASPGWTLQSEVDVLGKGFREERRVNLPQKAESRFWLELQLCFLSWWFQLSSEAKIQWILGELASSHICHRTSVTDYPLGVSCWLSTAPRGRVLKSWRAFLQQLGTNPSEEKQQPPREKDIAVKREVVSCYLHTSSAVSSSAPHCCLLCQAPWGETPQALQCLQHEN